MTREEKTLQMILTGFLMGAVSRQDLDVEVKPEVDSNGDYEPFFYVKGKQSGARMRVMVMRVDPEEEEE